jgi:hypothetical protein
LSEANKPAVTARNSAQVTPQVTASRQQPIYLLNVTAVKQTIHKTGILALAASRPDN